MTQEAAAEDTIRTARRGYAVMTYARCGATYFAQLLGATGNLGRPEDWFNGKGYRGRGELDYPLDRDGQVRMVLTRGMSANGVYGVKLGANRCDELRGFDWAGRLGPLTFVHLNRRDRLARAISDVISVQTGQFRSTAPRRVAPRYDGEAIRQSLARQALDEARVRQYFAINQIEPLEIAYEDLVDDAQSILSQVAGLIGIARPGDPDLTQVTLLVQRDAINEEWRARFLSGNRDLNMVPGRPRQSRILRRLGAGR